MRFQMNTENFDKKRWIFLIAGMFLLGTGAWAFTWSLMVDPMISLRGATDAGMATTYSVMMVTAAIFTVVGGNLCDKIGTTKMLLSAIAAFAVCQILCFVTHGFWGFAIANIIFASWQQSVVYIAIMAGVSKAFPDRRGLATSVAATGLSIVGAIISPLAQMCIDRFGFDAMFLQTGAILTILGLVTLALFPEVPDDYMPAGMKEEEEGMMKGWVPNPNFVPKDTKGMFKDPAFYLLFIIPLCATSGYMLLSYQLAYIATDILPVTPFQASFLISGVSIMGIVCIIMGPIGDKIGRLFTSVAMLALGTVAMAGLIFSDSHGVVWFAVCAFAYCFALGAWAGIHPALVGDFWGSDNFGGNYSICYLAVLGASMISPWLAVMGRTGESVNYRPTFTLCCILCLIGLVLNVILLKMKKGKMELIEAKDVQ